MEQKHFYQIDTIMRKNLEQRGMEKIYLKGELEKAAKELLKSHTVFIVTGFCIRDTLTGETDGPIGAVSLAGALEALGKKVVLITDKYSKDMLYRCCEVKKLKAPIEIVPYEEAEGFCTKLLDQYQPSHIVGIERPGRAKDGHCYSMRGESLRDIVPNTDILFKEGKARGMITLAVGDGGNEVGMGNVCKEVAQFVNRGSQICAIECVDYLIVTGISNWGGHGLTAALSLLTNRMLLHNQSIEISLLKHMIDAGAVDGCTKKRELTVDGLSLEENLKVLEALRTIVEVGLSNHHDSAMVI
ncbi:DUF4392 domain-containing protein [Clostridiaceae bacterium 35-E11]